MKNQRIHAKSKKIAGLFRNLGQPARLLILMAIGEGEACVCHLEALLGYRQAYISQHLMALRKDGLLISRRNGRYIFYRLRDPAILQLIDDASQIVGITGTSLEGLIQKDQLMQCCCPQCEADLTPSLITEELITGL